MRDWPVERVAHDWWVIDIDGVIEITWRPYPHHKRFETMVFGGPRSQDQRFYATETSMPECRWCSGTFEPRRGGKAQQFCSEPCRIALHQGARLWALAQLEAGRVTVDQFKEAVASNVYVGSRGDQPLPGIQTSPEPGPAPP